MSDAEFRVKWEKGIKALWEFRVSRELRDMEPFFDGYYADVMEDGRTRWEHLCDEGSL
jgi:hypothetical protein